MSSNIKGHWPYLFDMTSKGARKLAQIFRRDIQFKNKFNEIYQECEISLLKMKEDQLDPPEFLQNLTSDLKRFKNIYNEAIAMEEEMNQKELIKDQNLKQQQENEQKASEERVKNLRQNINEKFSKILKNFQPKS